MQSGVTSLILSQGPGSHMVDGMAEPFMAGSLGSHSLGLYLSSAFYWL